MLVSMCQPRGCLRNSFAFPQFSSSTPPFSCFTTKPHTTFVRLTHHNNINNDSVFYAADDRDAWVNEIRKAVGCVATQRKVMIQEKHKQVGIVFVVDNPL